MRRSIIADNFNYGLWFMSKELEMKFDIINALNFALCIDYCISVWFDNKN